MFILSIPDFCILSSVIDSLRSSRSDVTILTSQRFRFDVIILNLPDCNGGCKDEWSENVACDHGILDVGIKLDAKVKGGHGLERSGS